MKKTILVMIIFGCVFNANTQEKKIYLLGGDIGGFYTKNRVIQMNELNGGYPDNTYFDLYAIDLKNLRFQLTPHFFYFVSDRILVGVGVEWLRNTINYSSSDIEKTTEDLIIFYPAARGYIFKGIFIQGQFDIGKSFGETESKIIPLPRTSGYSEIDYSNEISYSTYGLTATAGYSIEFGSNVFIDCAIKYGIHKNTGYFEVANKDGNYKYTQNSFLVSLGIKYIKKK